MGITHAHTGRGGGCKAYKMACLKQPGYSRCSISVTCWTSNLHGRRPSRPSTWRSHRLLKLDTRRIVPPSLLLFPVPPKGTTIHLTAQETWAKSYNPSRAPSWLWPSPRLNVSNSSVLSLITPHQDPYHSLPATWVRGRSRAAGGHRLWWPRERGAARTQREEIQNQPRVPSPLGLQDPDPGFTTDWLCDSGKVAGPPGALLPWSTKGRPWELLI